MTKRRSRRRKTSEIVLNIVWVLAFLTFLVSAGILIWYSWRSGTEKNANNVLVETLEAAETSAGDAQESKTEKRLEAYAALAQQNPDMVGWLTIPGTNVNYPVMHTPSNPEAYLRRGFDKKYAMSGTPFLDAQCSIGTSGDNKIIYGHNMKDKTMFSVVEDFKQQSFYAEHRTLLLDTLTERGEYEIFAVLHVDTSYENPNALTAYQNLNGADAAVQQAYLDYVTTNRLYDTGVTAKPGDTFVTLSTCDNVSDAGRILLIARRSA